MVQKRFTSKSSTLYMYKLKKITLLLFLATLSNCGFAQTEFSLIGRWKQTEHHGNDGAHDYINKIKDGQILIFENQNVVRDQHGKLGSYNFDGKKLVVTFPEGSRYFFAFYGKDHTQLSLTPVTEKFEIICDEGCSDLYRRL